MIVNLRTLKNLVMAVLEVPRRSILTAACADFTSDVPCSLGNLYWTFEAYAQGNTICQSGASWLLCIFNIRFRISVLIQKIAH